MCLLCSLYCTVGSVVYIYLVSVMRSDLRSTEFSFIVQLGAIDCKLGLVSHKLGDVSHRHGDAWTCI
jgi:hypothetical protein